MDTQNAVGNPNAMFQRATTWDDWIWCQSWQRSVCQGAVAIRQLQKQDDQGVLTSSYKFHMSLERQAVAASSQAVGVEESSRQPPWGLLAAVLPV